MSSSFNSSSLLSIIPREDIPPELVSESAYGYIPTEWICILFLVLFGVSTASHFLQSIIFRHWFMLPTVVFGGLIELLGWSGRYWSSQNLFHDIPFMIQITATIIGPTPILAANFVIFGRMIRHFGTTYSRLRPRHYAILFTSSDIVSLVIQGAGGGMASSADNNDRDAAQTGTNVMLVGIALQLAIVCMFMLLATEYVVRHARDSPFREVDAQGTPRGEMSTRNKILLSALALNTFCLFVRAIYRVIELADGWDGEVMHTQWYFNFFDATMVIIAMYSFNIFHPGVLLKASPRSTSFGEKLAAGESTSTV